MSVNYEYYRIFYYVAKFKSFTQAANALVNSQPNITRSIKNLEQELGCSLFTRSNRQVQLTPEGEKLFSHIAPAMQLIQEGEESVLLHNTLQSGTVSIGVSEIALHMILLPVLESFRQEYPNIHFRIFNSNSNQAVSALKNYLVDFALVTPPIQTSKTFLCTPVATFQEVPICGKAYFHLTDQTLSMDALNSLPIISLCNGSSTYQLYTDWFLKHNLSFSPDIEAATADQILPMVRANLGIGFIPEYTARTASTDGNIRILRLQEEPPERKVVLLKRENTPLSVAATKMEQMLLQHSQEMNGTF